MRRKESSLRKIDEQNSRIITEWLEKNFYNKYVKNYSKKDDLINQVHGIDCTFEYNGREFKCDEKVAAAYINRELRTFAFELSFINRNNEIQDGWLLNEKLLTDSYLLVYINKAKKNILESINDIQETEIILLDKKDILEYLNDLGWSRNGLIIKNQQIRDTDGQTEMGNIWRNGCKFSYSKQLVEKPINVLIPIEELRKMNLIK